MRYLLLTALLLCTSAALSKTTLPDTLESERTVVVKNLEKYDWLRLNSGEWLKGELKSLYSKEIEFDSDVLDTLLIDREDVYMLLSGRPQSVRFNDGVVLTGPINISGGFVNVGNTVNKYTYVDLVSIAPSVDSLLSGWKAKISLGANLSKGNTEQSAYSAQASVKRRTASSRFLADFNAYRTKVEDETNKNNIRATATYDWFYNQKLYFRPVFIEYYRDPFQNIGSKYTLGAGVGYYFIDNDKTEWDLTAGPAFQRTKFDTVEDGESEQNSSTSIYLESNFERELTSRIDLNFDYRYTFAESLSGGDAQYANAGLEIEVTQKIDFDISIVWEHLDNPIADGDGITPQNDDYKLIFALGIDF